MKIIPDFVSTIKDNQVRISLDAYFLLKRSTNGHLDLPVVRFPDFEQELTTRVLNPTFAPVAAETDQPTDYLVNTEYEYLQQQWLRSQITTTAGFGFFSQFQIYWAFTQSSREKEGVSLLFLWKR